MNEIDQRQRELLRLLWREGRMSRWALHERTGINPNAIGIDVGVLLSRGLIRERQSEPLGPGRPRVPLEIDPTVRHVVGVAINPGRVDAGRLNLKGELLGRIAGQDVEDPEKIVKVALELLKSQLSEQTLSIGLSVTGFVDPDRQAILTSSSLVGRSEVSLTPIYEAAGRLPLILENNMHAFAARWMLTHQAEADEDVLLVRVQDGQLGAALLVDGRPNRGCAISANELGHMRFQVDTERCYCGQVGCLERICSTDFLRRQGVATGTFMEHAAAMNGAESAVRRALDLLSLGISNALNFVRPNRLVLVSELTRLPKFYDELVSSVRSRLLKELVERVRIDAWDQPSMQSAETAGWLALANLYREGWDRSNAVEPLVNDR
jgi:predicted NBD/HSP70 family sugar kinase